MAKFVRSDAWDRFFDSIFYFPEFSHVFDKHASGADVNAVGKESFEIVHVKMVRSASVWGAQGEHPAKVARAVILPVGIGVGGSFGSEGRNWKMDAGMAPDTVHLEEYFLEILSGQGGGEI